jgi:hypothetical protein
LFAFFFARLCPRLQYDIKSCLIRVKRSKPIAFFMWLFAVRTCEVICSFFNDSIWVKCQKLTNSHFGVWFLYVLWSSLVNTESEIFLRKVQLYSATCLFDVLCYGSVCDWLTFLGSIMFSLKLGFLTKVFYL